MHRDARAIARTTPFNMSRHSSNEEYLARVLRRARTTSRVVLTYLGFGDARGIVLFGSIVINPTAARNYKRLATHTSGTHLEDVSIIIRTRDDTERIERTTLLQMHT